MPLTRTHRIRSPSPRKRRSPGECSICLGAERYTSWVSVGCGHGAHKTCLRTWVATQYGQRRQPHCTTCRAPYERAVYEAIGIHYVEIERVPAMVITSAEWDATIDPATRALLERETKQCPHCTARVEKMFGCRRVECAWCHYSFCYDCIKATCVCKIAWYERAIAICLPTILLIVLFVMNIESKRERHRR